MRDNEIARGERGVSDLLAFTLTFSIIVGGIALVSLGGLGAFETVQRGAAVDVAETTMVGFAETTSDHIRDGAPRRTTSIKLQGHGLSQRSSALNVTVDGDSTIIQSRTLVRETDGGSDIVYTSGAVFRVQPEGLVVSREPSFRCSPDSAYLSVLTLTGQTNFSAANRVTLETSLRDETLVSPKAGDAPTAATVSVNVSNTAYPAAWQRLFERNAPHWDPHPSESYTYRCTGIDRAVIHNTSVSLRTIS
ncbi:DUF7289 family protein [Haloarcula salina]|uniref:DUF7289 family protein n=1 Tax=Haloarcula salina TaxID=1429914 RepID=UPI003C6FC21C